MVKPGKLGLIGKTLLWGVGTLGTLGIGGCFEPQRFNCDSKNCYDASTGKFAKTREQFIKEWTASFQDSYDNNPNYFITTKPEVTNFPEIEENFRVFKYYAIANKIDGAQTQLTNTDAFYNGERICSKQEYIDAQINHLGQLFKSGQTGNIEYWYSDLPEVQEKVIQLQHAYMNRLTIQNIRAQKNAAEWGWLLGGVGHGLGNTGNDIATYEWMKRN